MSKVELHEIGKKEQSLQEAVEELSERISVSQIRDTRLILLTTEYETPELAKDITNTLATTFIQMNMDSKRGEAKAALIFITEQTDQVSAKLKVAEEDLLQFKEEENLVILSEEARLKLERLSEVEASYQEVKIAYHEVTTRLNEIRKQLNQLDKEQISTTVISKDPVVENLRGQLTDLQIKLVQLESQFSPDAPQILQIKVQIDVLEDRLKEEVGTIISERIKIINPIYMELYAKLVGYETDHNALKAREDALNILLKDYESEVQKFPAQELRLIRLERDRRVNEELYTQLLTAKNEIQIEAASEIGNINVIDRAKTPTDPIKPRKLLNIIVGFVLSLIIGLGLAFLLEFLDNTVKTEEEAKSLLNLPVLGVIPDARVNGFGYGGKGKIRKLLPLMRKAKLKEGEKIELITHNKPKSHISEAYRTLRTNIQFADLDRNVKTIVVTSSIPAEGKTTVVANLAVAMAFQKDRVLLVDADLRRPRVHQIFDIPDSPGLTNILSGGMVYKETVKKVKEVEGLEVITSGPLPPNPSELLGSNTMKELIKDLKRDYDRVIFDSPPIIAVTDASVLASELDGTLLVLKAGGIERKATQRTREILKNAKVRVLGSVLNSVNMSDGNYNGYRGYYDYYSSEEDA